MADPADAVILDRESGTVRSMLASDLVHQFPPAAHTHPQSEITGLTTALAGKANASHTHPQSDITGLTSDLAAKAPLASPGLTGTPTAPTAAGGTNTTQLATTAFVQAGLAPKAPLASPALTGVPTAPTAAVGTNTQQLATTAFVQASTPAGFFPVATPVTKTTLQNAINAAVAAGGGTVRIPGGTHSINVAAGAVTISSGSLIIEGVGGTYVTGTMLDVTSAANNLFEVTTPGHVTFRNLAITASTVTKNAGTSAIYINETTTIGSKVVADCYIISHPVAVDIASCYEFHIRDNVFVQFSKAGIQVTQPGGVDLGVGTISGNKIWDIAGTMGAQAGIIWHRGSGLRIHNNRLLGAFDYGIHIQFDNPDYDDGALLISNNMIELQDFAGIYIERIGAALTNNRTIGQLVISGNHLQCLTSGYVAAINIAQSGGGGWVHGAVIADNIIQCTVIPAFNGIINIADGDGVAVTGNVIYITPPGDGGIRTTGTATNVVVSGNQVIGGTVTNHYLVNASTELVDTGVWTSYTPTVAAVSGSLTAASATGRYQMHGKTVFVEVDATITTNGTGATGINVSLPFAVAAKTVIGGKEVALVGFSVTGSVNSPGSTTCDIRKTDGTYPGGDGHELVLSGVYERA